MMKCLSVFALAALSLFRFSHAVWSEIYSDDPSVQCTPRNGTGVNSCCCYDGHCGNGGWEQPCGGDLTHTCNANQLIGPGGQGDHFTYTLNNVGTCTGPPSCPLQQWSYNWTCCDPPVMGNWIPYHGTAKNKYCPMAPFFVGCTEPNEVLYDNNESCMNTTCAGLKPVTSAYLTGYQAVVAGAFVPAVNGLTTCAQNLGGQTKLSVLSTSQCAASAGKSSTGAYQVGMAMDANLILPDGTVCTRNCMAQGYCAFHQSDSACANSKNCPSCQGQPQNQRNTWVNNFLQCAGTVTGLEVGATYNGGGNWTHFESPVSDQATALKKYVPQLKAYCFNLCPKFTKGNVGADMCNCPGFQ